MIAEKDLDKLLRVFHENHKGYIIITADYSGSTVASMTTHRGISIENLKMMLKACIKRLEESPHPDGGKQ
jgi:hypothetical protein